MPRDERAIVIARGGLAPSPPVVDAFDAIRTMGLRLQCIDLAARCVVRFDIGEAGRGVGWRVRIDVEAVGSAPRELDELELGIKSDVGALELAGHSIHDERPRILASVEIRPSSHPWRSGMPATWIAVDPLAGRALAAIRLAMVRALDERIRRGLATLRENGRDLDLGDGWTPPGPVVFTVPGEAVRESGERFLPPGKR
jgi:hypothetical protein